MNATTFSPGSIVSARGREWIILTGSTPETLRVRPISGSDEDQTLIHVPLELEPVKEASFPWPRPDQKASQDAALVLRDALILSLRRGAGPFRGFGQIAVEPRAYQLVPLLMALKLDPVRLLIADDVGIGKTIEAALIARELLDRGDIERTTVLCPPHLVEQWVTELEARFFIRAVAVTAASAARLERNLPPSVSIFAAHPHTVVSLDYIKSERRRAEFLRACPDFVIVDEAHACAATGQGRHQRYELLKGLSESPTRHMVLLTATPHSGDEAAFYRLLGLLDREFGNLAELTGKERDRLRERLARHFVQRRRPDIGEWNEGDLFPKRQTKELTYQLGGEWEKFFRAVLDYCETVVKSAEGDERRQRLNFWGTLALMRCVASSPAAAVQALRTRAGLDESENDDEVLEDRLFDGRSDALVDDDVEPPAATGDAALTKLITHAEKLAGQSGDPKLKLLTEHLATLVEEGFNPVVFCRYIATAHYLGTHVGKALKGVTVDVVTGELTSDERRERADRLGDAERRILIATDCLSEGINLQEHFDAVIHYDLSWNPTRHEQREGRVDRFGQEKKVVRATLIYGKNNPVDGAVLEVILRKAEKIREELGVPVPLPDDNHTLTQALMRAVFLRHKEDDRQQAFDFGATPEAKAIDATWQDAAEKAKRNRTVFAQRRLKPEEVLPEWEKTLAALGGRSEVKRFTERALARLGSPRCRSVERSHPLVSVLAETLLERTLGADAPSNDLGVLGRVGCWQSDDVKELATVVLLRLRHQLVTQRAGKTTTLLVEEATSIAWVGTTFPTLLEGEDALALLATPPTGDPPPKVRERMVDKGLELLRERRTELDELAKRRADALLADHRRVREAADARGSYAVHPLLPPDVIGVFILLPRMV
ncbi:DEAD/DEAH box helicase [Myxococcota bacterium]|nr:DEAD/DEAH box helicase [Myxococcota bacterium]